MIHEASQQAARKKSGRGRYSLATVPDEPRVGDFPPTCKEFDRLLDGGEGGQGLLHDALGKSDIAEGGGCCLAGGQAIVDEGFDGGCLGGVGILLVNEQPGERSNRIIVGSLGIQDKGRPGWWNRSRCSAR